MLGWTAKYEKNIIYNYVNSKRRRMPMESLEPKKLALLRIWQILKQHSSSEHPLTQEDIAEYLDAEYGIILERKAISRNLSLLREADIEIYSDRSGSYLVSREFEDSELRMLIDSVLCSKHITAKHSKDLIKRLCGLSNRYFRSHIKNIYSVNDWSKTENQALFFNIELIDDAIERKRQIHYNYNKYGADKKLHKTSHQYVSPYQLILHNQRYYLLAYSEYWGNMVYHRLDHITDMEVTELPLTPIRSLPGYENGIDYKSLSATMPYMFSDKPEQVEFLADNIIIDQIVDWFGKDARIAKYDDSKVKVSIKVSPNAMEHWAMQYVNYVEVISPASLRERIKADLTEALKKY